MADPRIIDHPVQIERITYSELRELSYMGANVLHEDAIYPVKDANIPIVIRNTNQPDNPARRSSITSIRLRKTARGLSPALPGRRILRSSRCTATTRPTRSVS